MRVLTAAQMREADKFTIEKKGIPSLTLMENAGIALANESQKLAPEGEILIVCGSGNNGGDGFVCARILKEKGRSVTVFALSKGKSDDCQVNRAKWLDMEGDIVYSVADTKYALIVDCLFGTGFHGALEGEEKSAVAWINQAKKEGAKVLSADIPSGVNGENGQVDGIAVQADYTLCIGEVKSGVLLGDGLDYAGKILRADIGIVLPKDVYADLTDEGTAKALLPARDRKSVV